MSTIGFFDPVTYSFRQDLTKPISKRVLEAVDEYFYFGEKPRIKIFVSDAQNEQVFAVQDYRNCRRCWTNIAMKVVSYGTVILPLAAVLTKAVLRSCLEVSSVPVRANVLQVQPKALSISKIERVLTSDFLQNILSFLSFEEDEQLAQVAVFMRKAVDEKREHYRSLMDPLERKAEDILKAEGGFQIADWENPSIRKNLQPFLFGLVTSPVAGRSDCWIPLMNSVMECIIAEKSDDTTKELLQSYANLFGVLAEFKDHISSNQIYQFCRYLARERLLKVRPWVIYRILEQYLQVEQAPFKEDVNKAFKECLTYHAKVLVEIGHSYCLFGKKIVKYIEATIDPKMWFGMNGAIESLLERSKNKGDAAVHIPDLLVDVLWERIQFLRNFFTDRPFMVSMKGTSEADLPYNFTYPLALRITNAGMFLDHGGTVNENDFERKNYAHRITQSGRVEREALALQYPDAVSEFS